MINGVGVDLFAFSPGLLIVQPNFLVSARFFGAKGIPEYGAAFVKLKVACQEAKWLLVGMPEGGHYGVPELKVMTMCEGAV